MSQAGIVDFIGTHPEIPTMFVANVGTAVPIANTIELLGVSVAAHGVPLQTVASGNTVDFNIQFASAAVSSFAGNAGVASFNSADFTVDANGFVSLTGSGATITITGDSGGPQTASSFTFTGTGSGLTFAGAADTFTLGGTLNVSHGGTGDTSFTAFSPIAGGTTSTGALQSISNVGALAGQVLTYVSSSALPTWQNNPGSTAIQTLSDDTNTTVTPSGGNIQLVGHVVNQTGNFSTVVAGTHLLNLNPMSSARWIVDPLGFNGTHTTISSAITSATSGDTIMIMPGTYTENLTLKPGVNLSALPSDGYNFTASAGGTPNVTIIGKATISTAGTVVLGSIALQTNSDFALVVSGSVTSSVILTNCQINATNNTALSMTSSSGSSLIYLTKCSGDIGTTGIGMWSNTGSGTISVNFTTFSNSGGSITASTASSGSISFEHSLILSPVSTSSTGSFGMTYSQINTSAQNVTALTTAGTGTSLAEYSDFVCGTASCVSIGAGTVFQSRFIRGDSSNTNVFTGAGTWVRGFTVFTGSSSGHNVTTETAYATLI